jgi:cytochrome P450
VGAAAAAIYGNRKKFYPGSDPDPNFSEPLPDGSLGCPMIGNISFFTKMGDTKSGMGKFYRHQAEKAGNSKIFKYFAFGKPLVIVAGMKNVKKVFNQEFRTVETSVISSAATEVMGGESMLFTNDPSRHQFLRRLVGQSLTPEMVDAAIPALIEGANMQIDSLSLDEPVEMEDKLTRYTLDVAWRQILGLDLQEDEFDTFNDAVNNWILGLLNPFVTVLPILKYTKAGKALEYLTSKIQRKCDSLEKNGPDGSTLSGMYFAKDEEDPTKRLSQTDIISNSLLLILAGSETAASTLTVAMLALGLHKDVFTKLKEEQRAVMAAHPGDEMTRKAIEDECPYLDAVIKETMRIKPLATTGAMRFAKETIVVDGKQIPEGFGVGFNPTLTHSMDPVAGEEDGSHMDSSKGF